MGYIPSPGFTDQNEITLRGNVGKDSIHQDLESVEKWPVRLSTLSKIDVFKVSVFSREIRGNFG